MSTKRATTKIITEKKPHAFIAKSTTIQHEKVNSQTKPFVANTFSRDWIIKAAAIAAMIPVFAYPGRNVLTGNYKQIWISNVMNRARFSMRLRRTLWMRIVARRVAPNSIFYDAKEWRVCCGNVCFCLLCVCLWGNSTEKNWRFSFVVRFPLCVPITEFACPKK